MNELYELPEGWEWKKLGSLTKTTSGGTPKRNNKAFWQGNIGWLKSGELNDGYVTEVEEFITEEGLKKSSAKLFPKGTLLIAMYGATVGKLAILDIETTTNQAICGVLNDKKLFDTRFMFFYFRNIRAKMLIDSTGGAQPNLSQTYIKKLDIPLPPLQEQKRIVAKLDSLFAKIDQAIALHQQNIDEAEGFMGSVLNEVFGVLEGKYSQVPLFEVANVARGKSKHRPRNDKKLFGGDYPFIQTGDVRNANKYIKTYSNTYSDFGLKQSKLWDRGTICMTIAANIGDVAILDMDSCFPDSVVGIYSDRNSNDFIYYFLLTLKQQLESKATTTAQMNINLKVLQTIGVPLPPLETQQKTVTYLDQLSQKTETLKQVQTQKMESLKALKASILDKAFRGEL